MPRNALRHHRSFRPRLAGAVLEARTLLAATIIDNGAAGYSQRGGFVRHVHTPSFEGDVAIAGRGSGSAVATWTFEGLTPGMYRVAATWVSPFLAFNPATDAPFTVLDGETPLRTVRMDQSVAPNDFTDAGANWEDLGQGTFFQVTGSTLVVELNNAANNSVYADAIRIESAVQPLVEVSVGGVDVPDNTGSVAFGTTAQNVPTSRTFTVRNPGGAPLNLGSVTAPSGFTVTAQPASTVSAGGSTSFTVRLDATSTGNFSGEVSFSTNVTGKNPFNFNVSGTVTGARQGPAASVSVGGQLVADGSGQVNFGLAAVGSTRERVFTVSNVGTEPLQLSGPIVLPTGFALASGFGATNLGVGESTTFTVRLNTMTEGFYSGRLTFGTNDPLQDPYDFAIFGSVGNSSQLGPELDVFDGTTPVPNDTGFVDLGVTLLSSPLIKTLTVVNSGTSTLALLSNPTLPTGFLLLTPFTQTSLEPGEVAAFTVMIDASTAGLFRGSVSFTSNDADENPYTFTIQALVATASGPDIQVLEGNAEYADGGNVADFGVVQSDTQATKTFTIRNLGTTPLTLGAISVPTGFVLVSAPATSTLAPAASTTFVVRIDTSGAGSYAGALTIQSNDPDENPFRLNLAGVVTETRTASLAVTGPGGVPIANGSTTIDFGNTPVGSPLTRTFTIRNTGSSPITLFGLSLPSGFSRVTDFAPTLLPGASTTFTVRLNATSPGVFQGTLLFRAHPGNVVFRFDIRGTVFGGPGGFVSTPLGDGEGRPVGPGTQEPVETVLVESPSVREGTSSPSSDLIFAAIEGLVAEDQGTYIPLEPLADQNNRSRRGNRIS